MHLQSLLCQLPTANCPLPTAHCPLRGCRLFYMFLGFFQLLPNLSIVPLILSFRVSSLFAVTIHSIYSFLFVNERDEKNSDCFLFFFKAAERSSGNFTSLVSGFTHL